MTMIAYACVLSAELLVDSTTFALCVFCMISLDIHKKQTCCMLYAVARGGGGGRGEGKCPRNPSQAGYIDAYDAAGVNKAHAECRACLNVHETVYTQQQVAHVVSELSFK